MSRNVRNITRAFAPDPMPEWYKQQLKKAQLSVKRVLAALPPSVLGSRAPSVDDLIDLMPESLSLLERIDTSLNFPSKKRKFRVRIKRK